MSKQKSNKSFTYYFLNTRLTPPLPKGYRVSIINLLINTNKNNTGKILLVKQSVGSWGLPREGIKDTTTVDDIFPTITRNLEEELGFSGMNVVDTKPSFNQMALLFNFTTQKYAKDRSRFESKKKRPTKGKIYHLAIMQYIGSEKLPLEINENNPEIINYKWVDQDEGKKLIDSNLDQLKNKPNISTPSLQYNIEIYDKVISTYNKIKNVYDVSNNKQSSIF